MKEKRGMLSYHAIVDLQVSHLDLPETQVSPDIERKITTLRKLPITAPNIKRIDVISKKEIDAIFIPLNNSSYANLFFNNRVGGNKK